MSAPTPSACICRSSGQLARPPGKLTVKGASAARPARRRNCATRAASGWAARVPRHTRDASRCNPATQPAWPIAFSAAGASLSSRAPGQTRPRHKLPHPYQRARSRRRPVSGAPASRPRCRHTVALAWAACSASNTRGSAVCMPRAVSTVISRAIFTAIFITERQWARIVRHAGGFDQQCARAVNQTQRSVSGWARRHRQYKPCGKAVSRRQAYFVSGSYVDGGAHSRSVLFSKRSPHGDVAFPCLRALTLRAVSRAHQAGRFGRPGVFMAHCPPGGHQACLPESCAQRHAPPGIGSACAVCWCAHLAHRLV